MVQIGWIDGPTEYLSQLLAAIRFYRRANKAFQNLRHIYAIKFDRERVKWSEKLRHVREDVHYHMSRPRASVPSSCHVRRMVCLSYVVSTRKCPYLTPYSRKVVLISRRVREHVYVSHVASVGECIIFTSCPRAGVLSTVPSDAGRVLVLLLLYYSRAKS